MVKNDSGSYVISENELRVLLENSFKAGVVSCVRWYDYKIFDKSLLNVFEDRKDEISDIIRRLV